ncbi:MAG: hypothetical protein HQL86_03110 [Magnetococcales bacterium]|nr:hypothetical protein [Magnetococcales bacterium]
METTLSKAARRAFFAKEAENASFEERATVKIKTLGDEFPKPSLFFTRKNDTYQAGCGIIQKIWTMALYGKADCVTYTKMGARPGAIANSA